MVKDPSECFLFANDFRPCHCFKLKFTSAPLNSLNIIFNRVIDTWNYLPK